MKIPVFSSEGTIPLGLGSAPAPGAADDAPVIGFVHRRGFIIRKSHHVRVRREGAPNSSRGGCAPRFFPGCRSATQFALAAVVLLAALGATAQTTNVLSDAEIQGRQLAQKLLDQQPTENFTNTGILKIRDAKGKIVEIPIGFRSAITETNWQSVYNIHKIVGTNENHPGWTSLVVTHNGSNPNQYQFYEFFLEIEKFDPIVTNLTGKETMIPFANSDFWIADLGLEFLHWPGQKVLRGDTARGRLCKVLESTNPNPSPNGYSRVLSWIDNEALGIVEAKAYDAQNKLLKEFYPKDIKKVDGQWQVGSMEIDNVQTGSRTRLEFDLKAK
jgi:hypothetical protein